ncbi:hypothetical protein MtrunA17_Chr4g0013521 [Medicago truncatula]|uniref:Transmembrane protein n=1 Tax=Medicago truncatula TaxID=3880 RepID=I3SMU0_MEDTR|nr:repetitive proline-rich cell wall protein [Medicago truncatula]AFK41582.1 unknown [Medicago truncatula]KEH29238.1 hypothetical protein MTR_4g029730 [Medicago truncatula]RHN59459.1 hypothetical protein MtrunA17_Chr4g0013521 [Medicago truncatula]
MASFRFLVLLLIVLIVIPQGLAQPECEPIGYGARDPSFRPRRPPGNKLPVYTPSMKKASVEKPPVKKPHVCKPQVEKP